MSRWDACVSGRSKRLKKSVLCFNINLILSSTLVSSNINSPMMKDPDLSTCPVARHSVLHGSEPGIVPHRIIYCHRLLQSPGNNNFHTYTQSTTSVTVAHNTTFFHTHCQPNLVQRSIHPRVSANPWARVAKPAEASGTDSSRAVLFGM
jgi:hypothetical protein